MASGFLVLIPAKGTSRRLPGKNKRPLCGKPLVYYSIRAALDAGFHPYVSTDDPEIRAIALQYGARVIDRPQTLADDSAEVVLHAMNEVKEPFDAVLLLQPTSPLRTAQHVKECVELFRRNKYASLVSVYEPKVPVHEVKKDLVVDGRYVLNGAVYIVDAARFRKEKSFTPAPRGIYLMKQEDSIDIDEEKDFLAAEAAMNGKKS